MRKGFKKNKKGFTLIELIIVIAILAILAAVAIPNFIGLQTEAKRGRDIGTASAIVSAINSWNAVYSDKQVTSTDAAVDADYGLLKTSNYWPKGIDSTVLSDALSHVGFTDGVAVVTNLAPPAAPSSSAS